MSEHIDKVALLDVKERKVLVARSAGKDKFYMPGGKREGDETDIEVLKREIKEEIGLELDDDSIIYFNTYIGQAHGKAEGVMIEMKCFTAEFEGVPKPKGEIEELAYLGYDNKNILGGIAQVIFEDLKSKNLID